MRALKWILIAAPICTPAGLVAYALWDECAPYSLENFLSPAVCTHIRELDAIGRQDRAFENRTGATTKELRVKTDALGKP